MKQKTQNKEKGIEENDYVVPGTERRLLRSLCIFVCMSDTEEDLGCYMYNGKIVISKCYVKLRGKQWDKKSAWWDRVARFRMPIYRPFSKYLRHKSDIRHVGTAIHSQKSIAYGLPQKPVEFSVFLDMLQMHHGLQFLIAVECRGIHWESSYNSSTKTLKENT